MESPQHCAYNRTKGCFLSLDVVAGDFSYAILDDWMAKLTPSSGMGLWMVPFKGILDKDVRVLLDLVYLGEDCRVIAVVESFPNFRVPPSTPPAASVLALPTQSISSTHTQPGDVLMICTTEEMTLHLEQSSSASAIPGAETGAIPGSIPSSEGPPVSTGPGKRQPEDPKSEQLPEPHRTPEKVDIEPETENTKPRRNWLMRWMFPEPPDRDKRDVPRALVPGLAAHFWTGGAPQVHGIRDISVTGLYVVTEERWYPGTKIRISLTRTDEREESAERSITVQAKVIRWGNDGVGLEFILEDPRNLRRGQPLPFDGADRGQIERFLKGLPGSS